MAYYLSFLSICAQSFSYTSFSLLSIERIPGGGGRGNCSNFQGHLEMTPKGVILLHVFSYIVLLAQLNLIRLWILKIEMFLVSSVS